MPVANAQSRFQGTFLPGIADPGDAAAIPVTRGGVCSITTAGVETRTVADAPQPGMVLVLDFAVDGGNLTITFASAIDQAGNVNALGEDAGDCLALVSTGNGDWRILNNDGYTLS